MSLLTENKFNDGNIFTTDFSPLQAITIKHAAILTHWQLACHFFKLYNQLL